MRFFYLRRNSDKRFFDGRYLRPQWSSEPRLFRSLSGMRNAILPALPREWNKTWWKEFCAEHPEPEMLDENHKYTPEFLKWRYGMWEEWRKFMKENRGLSFISDDFEILVVEVD